MICHKAYSQPVPASAWCLVSRRQSQIQSHRSPQVACLTPLCRLHGLTSHTPSAQPGATAHHYSSRALSSSMIIGQECSFASYDGHRLGIDDRCRCGICKREEREDPETAQSQDRNIRPCVNIWAQVGSGL